MIDREAQFEAALAAFAADQAPQLFAVVEVRGNNMDGRIAAWGLSFEDRAEVVSADGGMRASAVAATDVLRLFPSFGDTRARVVWVGSTDYGAA